MINGASNVDLFDATAHDIFPPHDYIKKCMFKKEKEKE